MRKGFFGRAGLALLAAASLAMGACTTTGLSATEAPAPLAQTVIDDQALEKADQAFDLALDAINLLVDTGYIKTGTPRAVAIAKAIRQVDSALNVAAAAAAVGHTTSYAEALVQAQAGIAELRTLLKGN